MNIDSVYPSRRRFIRNGTLATALLAVPLLNGQNQRSQTSNVPERPPALNGQLVNQIVRFSHGQPDKVKQLLKDEPGLVNATWDWGGGDFEMALGAASHMGRKDIAQILIDAGARKDMFYFAMEGNLAVLRAAIDGDPSIVNVSGPHTLTLFYHAAISGNIDLAKYLQQKGALIDDSSLNASVQFGKHYEMTEWLLDNGATYYGQSGFRKKPMALTAREQGLNRLADLLESRQVPKPLK